jgi:hypothetical protein
MRLSFCRKRRDFDDAALSWDEITLSSLFVAPDAQDRIAAALQQLESLRLAIGHERVTPRHREAECEKTADEDNDDGDRAGYGHVTHDLFLT